MTTIAYRDGVLAADTQVTYGDTRDGSSFKITKRGRILAAASGCAARAKGFRDWFDSGMNGDPPEMGTTDKDRHAAGYLFDGKYILSYSVDGWSVSTGPFFAGGSGWEIAMGAMAMGATAERAVQVAAMYDTNTGGKITVLRN